MAKSDLKQYSSDELRIMAYGQALRRYGPGVEVNVDETPDGTYRVRTPTEPDAGTGQPLWGTCVGGWHD